MVKINGGSFALQYKRTTARPIDSTSTFETLKDAMAYARNVDAEVYFPYPAQVLSVEDVEQLYMVVRDMTVSQADGRKHYKLKTVATNEDSGGMYMRKDVYDEVAEQNNFIRGLKVGGGKAVIDGDGTVTATGVNTLNLVVRELARVSGLSVERVATLFQTVVKDYVSSEVFTSGLSGSGFKLYKALGGDWNLEIDNLVVRKAMSIFMLMVTKTKSVNGGLVISQANGVVSRVTDNGTSYTIGIEGGLSFEAGDVVRCQTFGSKPKRYGFTVSQGGDQMTVSKQSLGGAVPEVGDELVQMGNDRDVNRQSLIFLSATEQGRGKIEVLDGVNSSSLAGKAKVVLGYIGDITDVDFTGDAKPTGYGLYTVNMFAKGVFVLRNGKTVEGELGAQMTAVRSDFEIREGQISLKVTEAKEAATNAKVSQTAAEGVLKTVTRIESEISVKAGEISLKVTEATEAATSAKKTEASINLKADGIVMEASQTAAEGALAGMQGELDKRPTTEYIKSQFTLDASGISLLGKKIALTGVVTFSALAADAKGKITAAQTAADEAKAKATQADNNAYWAQRAADSAQADANSAYSMAEAAQRVADAVDEAVGYMASDNWLTADEKQMAQKEWEVIVSEKGKNDAMAVRFGVSTAAYATAYNTLSTYITPLLSSLTSNSSITGSVFRARFKGYYDARTDLLNAISVKAKEVADAAQVAAQKVGTALDTLKGSMGGLAYKDMVSQAQLDSTIIEGGYIKASLLDVGAIVTSTLVAGVIATTEIETGKLRVTEGAKIGLWSVTKDGLRIDGESKANILMEMSGGKFLRINDRGSSTMLSIRNDNANGISIYTGSDTSRGLTILAQSGHGTAIESTGGHEFNQRAGEKWSAPGAIAAGRVSAGGYLENKWGDGCTVSAVRTATGRYEIRHNLNHTQYYIFVAVVSDNGESATIGGKYSTSIGINIRHADNNKLEDNAFEFVLIGRNTF